MSVTRDPLLSAGERPYLNLNTLINSPNLFKFNPHLKNQTTPIGGTSYGAFALQYMQTTGDITGQSLYNGNTSNTTLAVNQLNSGNPVGYTYHYDQLNRLKKMRQYNGLTGTSWDRSNITPNYQENITYDGNGNILTYGRNGDSSITAQTIDSLTYNYNYNYTGSQLVNNKLNYIHDAITSSGYNLDLRNQTNTTNYQYDAIGNLITDVYSGITNIDWTVYNKPDEIDKASGNITYAYNTANQRSNKSYNGVTTWYVRDAQGNVMGIYDNTHGNINWREQHLYGSSRLGMWLPDINLATGSAIAVYDTLGKKRLELDNHLGNDQATITDTRLPVTSGGYFAANIAAAQDYYPFGMLQPGRQYVASGDSTYRYGFNGKEQDNEVMGYGNWLDYGERMYDPRRVGFGSVDPLYRKYPELSTYQFASSTPIQAVDLDGLEAAVVTDPRDNVAQDIRTLVGDSYKAVIGYVTRVENTDEGIKRTWAYVHGQPPSLRLKAKMEFSAIMLNSQGANHAINPAQILIDAGKDVKEGHYLSAGLGVLAIVPGLEELKPLEKLATFGKCTEFAGKYFSKFNKAITKAGGTIERFEINVGKNAYIGTFDRQLSVNGMHQFLEVTKDGETLIIDNLHPQGVPKEEYIKSLSASGRKLNNGVPISGDELIEKYTKKVN